MGLDMYLSAEKYLSGYEHSGEEAQNKVKDLCSIAGLPEPTEYSPSVHIKVTVCYWRKANAIHAWFVRECQDGNDDCEDHRVEREQLQELVDKCKQVLRLKTVVDKVTDSTSVSFSPETGVIVEKSQSPGLVVARPESAEEILPTQSGFFFGRTDYDQYYLEYLKHTVETLEKILADDRFNDCDFYYRSSW